MVHALGAQTLNVSFVETGFTFQTDFIAVWYSVTNYGLLSNSLFCFHGNVVKVSCMWENTCNVFAAIYCGLFHDIINTSDHTELNAMLTGE
jgi:hypothetical protein